MINDKVREEFEAWVLSDYPNQHMGRFATGEYHSTVIEHCWQAWQASREALVIELPEGESLFQRMYGVACERPPLIERKHALAAIEAAGVKVMS